MLERGADKKKLEPSTEIKYVFSFFQTKNTLDQIKADDVGRYDSQGPAKTVCPSCLLNVCKMDSGPSKPQNTGMHSCSEES